MDTKQTHKLRKFIKELASIRGRHTELISVYVPAGYDINKIIQHMEEEQGTASNIKDKTTRTHVIDSLERAIRHLRLFKKTPENGIAVFAGNASERDNVVDIKVWSLETPEPLKFRLYRCDQTFVLDPLKEMLEHKETYGLIVLDRREATIGLLRGTSISQLINITSGVPGKTQAGGQCIKNDTLIMLDNGEIIKIQDAHNPLKIISCKLNKQKISQTNIREKWDNERKVFRIITKYPRITIEASSDHTFFVRTNNGIEEKPLSEIKEGDFLIMPEKIEVNNEDQKINFSPQVKQSFNLKPVKIPEMVNQQFAKLLGYYLGDGCYEVDRITFFEQREDVAKY